MTANAMARERGFALLIVLWTMALLAFIGTHITSEGRGAAQLAQNLRGAAMAEAAADGAVQAAIFHVLDPSRARWRADGAPHELRLPGGVAGAVADIRITDEAGRLNPNTAPAELLAALLRALGVSLQDAVGIANAMVVWRTPGEQPEQPGPRAAQYRIAGRSYGPPGEPFQSLDEIGLVLGMTPDILARLVPFLSLYNQEIVNRAAAAPLLRRAIAQVAGPEPQGAAVSDQPPQIVAITATAAASGSRFTRHAVVQLVPDAAGRPFITLAWERVDG